MNVYSGIYYIQGGVEHTATFSFFKDKLNINFKDEYRHERKVYWYYDEIVKAEFWQTGRAIINYNGYPKQTIEIASKQFADELEENINRQSRRFLLKAVGHSLPLLRILFILFVLLLVAYFWLVPYLAVRLAEKVPVSYEEDLGRGMYNAMKAGFKIDEKRTGYINNFFNGLNISSPYNIHITVVHDEIPNAFAMPGGNIILYDKILAGMDNYNELAALLSHEFSHVQNKHTTKSLFRQMGTSIFLNVISGNTSAVSNALVGQANNLKTLSYSRRLEKEADLAGVQILAARKIDCNGFAGLFEMLKKQSNIQTSEWMSSHPDLENRIEYIQRDPAFNKNGIVENETLKAIFIKIKAGK
ncbi:MAG: hypothetical protein JWM28_65 [Chitinophagaceae bacterium]|nr:hypothetical protein [Chitinophagaceae bacterium]